jgi:hypothetical protein
MYHRPEYDSEPLRFEEPPPRRGGGGPSPRPRRRAGSPYDADYAARGDDRLTRRDVEGYAADYREGGPPRGRADTRPRRGGGAGGGFGRRGPLEQPATALRGFPGELYDRWPGSRRDTGYDGGYRPGRRPGGHDRGRHPR